MTPVQAPARTLKFYIETYGCQMNLADSEEMGRALRARGLVPTEKLDDADWVLVNSCTVRQHAEHRALSFLGRLRDWKEAAPDRRIIFAGCAAERLSGKPAGKYAHVDLTVGAKSVSRFDELLGRRFPETFDAAAEARDAWSTETDYASFLADGAATGYVTIMRGCNYSCSYCIVPAVRGPEVYRPAESVLAEVRQKAARGLPEVMLLGQTVNSYRPNDKNDFAALLRAVDAVPGVSRIRFMSPHPFYVNEALAAAYADCANLCPHIHLPVQSGSDAVLKRMRRNYGRAEYLRRVETLRRARPDISITTDVIAGFPGETEGDFAETLSLLDEAGVDAAYCFKYSARPGTESAVMPGALPEEVVEERHARLLEKTNALSEIKVKALHGTRQEIMIDAARPGADGWRCEGRTRTFWKISYASRAERRPGQLVRVEVESKEGRYLGGREC